jgi:hypothetical protein
MAVDTVDTDGMALVVFTIFIGTSSLPQDSFSDKVDGQHLVLYSKDEHRALPEEHVRIRWALS